MASISSTENASSVQLIAPMTRVKAGVSAMKDFSQIIKGALNATLLVRPAQDQLPAIA